MLACFKGTISAKLNNLQQQLQRTDIVPQPNNKKQVQKLNNLESQAWLYEGILDRLGIDPSANHEKIARTLEALEYKRSEILKELEPRRPRRYLILARLQNYVRTFLASQAEKDYEQLQQIVTNLVLFTRSREPSQIILSEVIDKLATEISQSINKISPYRLRLAYRIDELIRVLSTKLVLGSNGSRTYSSYQSIVNELRSRLNLLSKEFNNLLRNKQINKNELDNRIKEIYNLSTNISNLYREISNRDADIVVLQENIQNLTGTIQDKQAQINTLQNSISELRRSVQKATKINLEKQNNIDNLQTQISQLNQQKSDLQRKTQDLSTSAQIKVSELEELQKENYQLKEQLAQARDPQSSTHSSAQNRQNTIKPKTKENKISVEEYEKISNQSDYEYVNEYHRQDGTYVRGYYRRRRRR